VTISTKGLRSILIAHPKAIPTAIKAVVRGPARLSPTSIMSEVRSGGHLYIPPRGRVGLSAWAGAALLRSLVTNQASHNAVIDGGGLSALLKLSRSKDHLERTQADAVLRGLLVQASSRDSAFVSEEGEMLEAEGFISKKDKGEVTATSRGPLHLHDEL